MKILAHEGLESAIVVRLRADGHSVRWIAEFSPSVSDEQVLRLAVEEEALLVTEDKDFGELVYRRGLTHSGVMLVRLEGQTNEAKADLVSGAIGEFAADLIGAFSVVTKDSMRVRKSASSAPLLQVKSDIADRQE